MSAHAKGKTCCAIPLGTFHRECLDVLCHCPDGHRMLGIGQITPQAKIDCEKIVRGVAAGIGFDLLQKLTPEV